ncbi:MAG: hypothetical protein ABS75_14945 [Pelagibacterium sp. SCN 63-23]|nr:MAG: hypothetical protein ABS75_14945 [Pelagibacterium sp. SCN 63-23]
MRKIIVTTALAAMLVAGAAPAFAADEVFGHSAYYASQAIAAQGYTVTNVEEWGNRIAATVIDAQGHASIKVFDADTLRPAN